MNNIRKNKPVETSDTKFNLPLPEEFYMDNGLRVIFIKKNNLPMVRTLMLLNAGSKYDPAKKNGLSYLTTLTLDEGAGGLNALELSDAFDMLGSSFSLSTDNDFINISLQSLSEHFDKSFELFSKVILQPDFNQQDFEREKKKLITRILQSKDEPDYLADQIFDNLIFTSKNPYAYPVAGYEETVSSLCRDDVHNFYQSFFHPSNSVLIVVGDIELITLKNTLQKHLSYWVKKGEVRSVGYNNVTNEKRIYVCHKDNAVQTEIRIGHLSEPRNPANYFSRLLLNTILGGQFNSRINLNLRERNGYTYGATSRFQYYQEAAFFEVSTSVGIDNTANAVKEILSELELIKDGIKDSEIQFAKSSITKKFPLNFETYRQLTSGLAGRVLFNLPSDYFSNYVNTVNSVRKEEVELAATNFIMNDNLAIVLVGDKNKLIPQIQYLGVEIFEVDPYGNIVG